MERKYMRIISGIMSVVMFVFSFVQISGVSADDAHEGILEIIDSSATINGQPITDDTVVSNGDTIAFTLDWQLNQGGYTPPVTFKTKLNLGSVSLDKFDLGESGGAYYEINGDYLYITLNKGLEGREGSCRFTGKLSFTEADLKDGNRVEITYLDKIFTPKTHDFATGLWINKAAGAFTQDGDGKYYQEYTVEVHNYSANTVKGAVLKDEFKFDDTGIFANGKLVDLEIDGTPYGSEVNSGDTITLPDIDGTSVENGKTKVTLTYKVEVSSEKVLSGNLDKANTATVTYKSGTEEVTATGTAWANPPLPTVSKQGVLSDDKKNVTWTITVNPNMLDDNGNVTITVVDTPDGKNLTAKEVAAALGITVADDATTVTIPFDDSHKNPDGSYSRTYTTAVHEGADNTIFGTYIGNSAEITITPENGNPYTGTANGSVTIPGVAGNYIAKTAGSMDSEGVMDWTITLTVPNDEKIESFNIWDMPTVYGGNYATHIIDFDSFEFEIAGETEAPAIDVIDKGNNEFDIKFDAANNSIDLVKGKTLIIKYKTTADKSVSGYQSKQYINTAQIWLNNGAVSQQVTALISPGMSASKAGMSNGNNGSIKWEVKATNITGTYEDGDVITIVDTIPDGHSFDNSLYYGSWINGTAITPIPTVNGQTLTFEIPLDAGTAAAFTAGYEFSISFYTKMDPDAYYKAVMSAKNGDKITVTNNAIVSTDENTTDDDIPISGSCDFTVDQSGILDKVITSTTENDDRTFTATYRIDVNKEGADLNPESDTLELTDTLGAWLRLVGSPTITRNDSGATTVENCVINGQVLTFTLADNTAYTITYTVEGNQIRFDNTVSADYIDKMFSNTVVLKGGSNGSVEDKFTVDDDSYTYEITYQFTINLSGKKTWHDDKFTAARPKKIEIKIKYVKYDPLGVEIDSGYRDTFDVVAPDSDTNVWDYTISMLPSMDEACNTYEYSIEEVTVDGYKVELSEPTTDGTNLIINIDNTFEAGEKEVGKVKVNKVWDDDGNTEKRPSTVTFKLINLSYDNLEYTATLDVDEGDYVIFEKLPLYKYGRADDGTLTREFCEYQLTEVSVDGYETIYSESGVFTLTDQKIENMGINNPVELTVTNKLETTETTESTTETSAPEDNESSESTTTTPAPEEDESSESTTTTPAPEDNESSESTTTTPAPDDSESSESTTTTPAPDDSESSESTTTTTAPNGGGSGGITSVSTPVGGGSEGTTTTTTKPSDDDSDETTTTTKPSDDDSDETTTTTKPSDDDSDETTTTTKPSDDDSDETTTTTKPDGSGSGTTTTTTRPGGSQGTTTTTTKPSGSSSGGSTTTTTKPSDDDSDETTTTTKPSDDDSDETTTTTKPSDDDSDETTTTTEPSDDDSDETTTTTKPSDDDSDETTTTTKPSDDDSDETTTTTESSDDDSDTLTTLPPDDDMFEDYDDGDGYYDDSDSSDGYEENPNTGISLNLTLFAGLAFGAYAVYPRKKKRK